MENKQEIKKQEQKYDDKIVRILSKDIKGNMKIYPGLTKIKGVSWSLSNATCKNLAIDKDKKIGSLNESEIKKIIEFLKNPKVPTHMKNRRKDFKTGEDVHLVSSDLELQKEFDVKRLRQIASYRGFRHAAGLPMRGQRTKSNFRRNRRKGAGIKKKQKKEGVKK